jgi:hypothetical protein
MFVRQAFLLLLFLSLIEINLLQNISIKSLTTKAFSTSVLNGNITASFKKVRKRVQGYIYIQDMNFL